MNRKTPRGGRNRKGLGTADYHVTLAAIEDSPLPHSNTLLGGVQGSRKEGKGRVRVELEGLG